MTDKPKYVGFLPDPNAPSLMMQGKLKASIKYVVTCPRCGSPDVTADATARWDVETQSWKVSDTFEPKNCGSCLYEGKNFYDTPSASLTPAQKDFLDGKVDDYVLPENI